MACINVSNICKNFIQFWLQMSCYIQINQNRRSFPFPTIKILVLIFSDKISPMFSGEIPTVLFNQFSDASFDFEN